MNVNLSKRLKAAYDMVSEGSVVADVGCDHAFLSIALVSSGKSPEAFACDGPFLIDCAIDKDEFVLPMLPPGGSMDDIITRIGD